MNFDLREITDQDRDWLRRFIVERWGADRMLAHGTLYYPHQHAGFAIFEGEQPIGVITYRLEAGVCEIITLDSSREGCGVGTALIETVIDRARQMRGTRVWLITTNDNVNALRFYQKRGFVLAALHREAVTRARQIKPEIPLIGEFGIPIRDEIELEMTL